jgi:hypothetical protein
VGSKPKSAEVRARFFTPRTSGVTLKPAVAAAGVSKTTGHHWLTQSGGVRRRVWRPRSPLRLSLEERETISRGLAQKKTTLTAIAGGSACRCRRCRGRWHGAAARPATALPGPTG